MTNQAIHRNIVNELFIVRASIKKINKRYQFVIYDTFFFFSILYFVRVFACFVLNGNRSWYMV